MSESSPISLGNPLSPTRRPGALGIHFPGTQIKIVDPENFDVEVEIGSVGELLVKGSQGFQRLL